MPLEGIEPSHLVPEASALSAELQGHINNGRLIFILETLLERLKHNKSLENEDSPIITDSETVERIDTNITSLTDFLTSGMKIENPEKAEKQRKLIEQKRKDIEEQAD